ncbi:DNA glycosylase [Nemania diffusa]|nr:DNA glycosylase [Nemania diffusa]
MDFSACTGQSPATNPQPRNFCDDFVFGFDVEDDDDREYLGEVAMHGIGQEDDVKSFVRLGLLRGVEEWEQAICCASAMKDRGHFQNPLDGQDILTFLSQIYGVDELHHAASAPSLPQRSIHPRTKRKFVKTRASLDAKISPETQAKKKRKVKKSSNSPYWADISIRAPQEDELTGNPPESKETADKVPTRCKKALGAILPTSTFPTEDPRDDAVIQLCQGPELTPISLDNQHESLASVSPVDIQGLISQPRDDNIREALENPLPALPGSFTPTVRVDTSESNIELAKTGGQAYTSKLYRTPDNENKPPASPKQTPKRKAKSPYFETTQAAAPSPTKPPSKGTAPKRPPRGTVSSLPFPRLDSPRFGLIQEELADDPFRLLVAVTFLIRTTGKAAIPVFRALMETYPTPDALAAADPAVITGMIAHLGLGAVRAATIQRYARIWLDDPPRAGVRHVVKNYHCANTTTQDDHDHARTEGREEKEEEEEEEVMEAAAAPSSEWEIGHMTQGPYALDSWRIFCRDALRGAAADWRGGGREGEFQPEWMRVLPRDKELRACLRWLWMREGWLWDPETGDKAVLPDALRRAVQEGRVGYDDSGDLRILDERVVGST